MTSFQVQSLNRAAAQLLEHLIEEVHAGEMTSVVFSLPRGGIRAEVHVDCRTPTALGQLHALLAETAAAC